MKVFENFNLEHWLEIRSVEKKNINGELIFIHKDNTTTILVPSDRDNSSDDIILLTSPLAWFYEKYDGASIGNGHIILASSREGGIEISHGFKIPDRDEMTNILGSLNIVCDYEDFFIGVESAWMFAYAIRRTDGTESLIRFDRDLQTSETVANFKSVFEDWWNLVSEDS